jgi:N-acetylglutamate synthase-like GNAT family acetyltransferase
MAKTPSGQVVGTGRLHTLDQQRGQIRYMAVESGFERQGIASAILTRLEEEARRLSLHEIVLHARDKAVGFYSRHGYADGGCAPATCDIPHQVMSKTLA